MLCYVLNVVGSINICLCPFVSLVLYTQLDKTEYNQRLQIGETTSGLNIEYI